MNNAVDKSPKLDTMLNALAELEDICLAAQELSERYRERGRPYLRFRARELENECHDLFHVFELLSSGWEPTNYANDL